MRRKALFHFVSVAGLVILVMVSCRDAVDRPTPTGSSTSAPTATNVPVEDTAVQSSAPERVTVEVTRVVVDTELVIVTPEPVEEVPEPKELVVCIPEEPETLYPYGLRASLTPAHHVLHGIYESLYTNRSFSYQARGIDQIPSLEFGDAKIEVVEVEEGDIVVDSDGDVVTLRNGIEVTINTGEEVSFEGDPLLMNQMSVLFTLKPLRWSDGTLVTADDSVYSFELAADPHTPVPKQLVARTSSYNAVSEREVQWTGVPGYLDRTYFTNVWPPYPRHYWSQYSAEELLEAEVSTRNPLSTGPFVVREWIEGSHITLEKNDNYYLGDEGYPRVDTVRFEFIASSSQIIASLLSGQCDIATQDGITQVDIPSLLEADKNGLLTAYSQIGTVFEHVDFGINPVNEYVSERPDWFEDVRVRQAVAMCIDRQRMVDELLYGQSEVIHAYVPTEHPLFPSEAAQWPYDPLAANELLDSAGYADLNEDGIRDDPRTGSIFRVKLLSSIGNELAEEVAFRIREDLLRCGIEIEPVFLTNEEYFTDGPEGPLFGRKFDMAEFPWLISTEPNCALYLSSRIPSKENAWNRSYNNQTGYVNEEFDRACTAALASLPGMPDYKEYHSQAIQIWTEQLPVVPLFMRSKVAAARPEIRNLTLDPTQPSELWNLYEIDIDE